MGERTLYRVPWFAEGSCQGNQLFDDITRLFAGLRTARMVGNKLAEALSDLCKDHANIASFFDPTFGDAGPAMREPTRDTASLLFSAVLWSLLRAQPERDFMQRLYCMVVACSTD